MDTPAIHDLGRIAQDLQIRKVQVESVVALLDADNTVPFITRYRKEQTGGLNEDVIRQIERRVASQRQLAERKQTILKSIQAQGKLTEQLQHDILAADTAKRLEDLYLPYKPKKRTLATVARERGLEPLALAVWGKDPTVAQLDELLPTFVNPEKELATPEDVRAGLQHILAELIAETADVREAARRVMWETGKLTTVKAENLPPGQGLDYKDYFQFTEPVRQIPPHRILAINRGERENALKAKVEVDTAALQAAAFAKLPLADHPHAEFLKACALDALQRLLIPSLEREVRRDLTDEAEDHAVRVFSRNLRSLLLQPPIRGQRALAIDPGFRTGCKAVILDETGTVLEHGTIYPHPLGTKRDERRTEKKEKKEETSKPEEAAAVNAPPPAPAPVEAAPAPEATPTVEPAVPVAVEATAPETPAPAVTPAPQPSHPPAAHRREEAKAKLEEWVHKHHVTVIAIGNGTACRETEELVSELIAEKLPELAYVIVNEAGASHYSASTVGREEFPDLDATVRGTISIGRRLQDPLSELVKIDPQNIGVGLYQHDLSQKRLKESLDAVIESCVNHVGVDLNTASVPLLRHISGLNQLTSRSIVEYRKEHGPYRNREQLRQVPGIGEVTFTQAVGFLKVQGGDQPLDSTWIHPESYPVTQSLLSQLGYGPEALQEGAKLEELREKLKTLPAEEVSTQLAVGVPTLRDIVEALSRPGRDPREDLPKPIFKKGILKLEDLQPGMELKGTVLNVVDFGAFVDIGLKDSGLVHISQLANRYVKSPYDVVSVGDVVTVWVLNVDHERRRVSLTMIKPGTERKPPERGSAPPQRRQGQGQGHGRGRRPAHQHQVATPQTAAAAAQQKQEGQEAATAVASGAAQTRQPPQRRQQQQQARRPQHQQRPKPKPKLSEEALQGAKPLRSFAELAAFMEATKKQD
jgi:competence ComEA-like helix-hairpin-helix protein